MREIPVGITLIDDAIPDCAKIVDYLRSQEQWRDSGVGPNGEVNSIRTSKTISYPMLGWQNDPLIHEMNRAAWKALDEYASEWKFSFSYIEDVSIQRYETGDFYGAHTDHDPAMPRIVSAVAYLNTVEDGGGTRFTKFDYTVNAVEGRLAIFPSNYVYEHEAIAPVSGFKIAAAYWARG